MSPFSLSGRNLGKYQILEPLGSGGMARVYRAFHPQLNRYVAVKVLRGDLVDDDAFLSRFRQEAQSIANLRHPNIIQAFDFDVQDDITYMVMELLDGDTLNTRLNDYRVRDEHLPWGDMVRILLDVLDGLSYAHGEGVIHRDIKPANILLTKRGQVVLADFGIAQIVGGTRHTVSGMLLGTINYMAPEQGLKHICNPQTDIYSVGIILYEMLTRQPPFNADTPLAILMKHVNDPLPLPKTIEPSIPDSFERIVLKALAKEPEDRYQLADEMAQALHEAAGMANIEIPERISMPLSFTTLAAPAESVAVFSGDDRSKLAKMDTEDSVAATDAHLHQTLADEIAALKAAESPLAHHDHVNVTEAILKSFALIVGGNLIMIMLTGVNNHIWVKGWPMQFFLVAGALAWLMTAVSSIWFLIPILILFLNGFLFAYSVFSGNWAQWVFLWPLELFILAGAPWYTISLAQDEQQVENKSRTLGRRISRYGLSAAIVCILMALIWS